MTVLLVGTLVGCDEYAPTATEVEKKAQEQLMQQVADEIGMPEITEFYEKKMAKEILELRDDSKLITYAYTVNLDGQYVYLGQCMGYGLPYSTQYTNPDMVSEYYGSSGRYVISQADPNGLYSPDGLSATWLMLINEETGGREVIYCEPEIVVTQSKLPKRLVADWSLPENY